MSDSGFVDADGTVWHLFAGLPSDYPNTGEATVNGGAQAGLTFRADTGEVRVLPRAAIPRRGTLAGFGVPLGSRMPTQVDAPDWQDLLRHALPWPPA